MRLPAYGRDLVNLQRSGRNVEWLVIALGFDIGRALPRVVVTDDIRIDELDLRCVAGVACMVAHRGNDPRALDVAELALRNGAKLCGTHDQDAGRGLTTEEVISIRGRQ